MELYFSFWFNLINWFDTYPLNPNLKSAHAYHIFIQIYLCEHKQIAIRYHPILI